MVTMPTTDTSRRCHLFGEMYLLGIAACPSVLLLLLLFREVPEVHAVGCNSASDWCPFPMLDAAAACANNEVEALYLGRPERLSFRKSTCSGKKFGGLCPFKDFSLGFKNPKFWLSFTSVVFTHPGTGRWS